MVRYKGTLGIGLLLAISLLAGGCVSRAQQRDGRLPMLVAIVNVERILPELPEYREYSEKYMQDREKLFDGLPSVSDEQKLKAFLSDSKRQEIEKSVQKWDELKRKFTEQMMERIRASANAVAREKGIDVVLVSAPWHKVGQRMAVDITTDVILALKESGQTVH
jgi:Skp family chaperone for outer membrane proteins